MKILRYGAIGSAPTLHPDSSLLPHNQPFFIPDVGLGWQAVPYVAVRIGRLGKNITAAFAPRYIADVSVAFHFREGEPTLPQGYADAMDGIIAVGEPLTAEPEGVILELAAAAIAEATAYMTVKSGDLLLLPHPETAEPRPLASKERLSLSLQGEKLLTVKTV